MTLPFKKQMNGLSVTGAMSAIRIPDDMTFRSKSLVGVNGLWCTETIVIPSKQKIMKKIFALLLASFVIAGCVTVRPPDDNEYKQVISAIIPENEQLQFEGHAVWIPNRSILKSVTIFDGGSWIQGNLIITDKQFMFTEYNDSEKSMNIIFRKKIKDIESVKLDTYGIGHYMVIRANDTEYNMFSYSNSAGVLQSEKTDSAIKYLKQAIQKNANK